MGRVARVPRLAVIISEKVTARVPAAPAAISRTGRSTAQLPFIRWCSPQHHSTTYGYGALLPVDGYRSVSCLIHSRKQRAQRPVRRGSSRLDSHAGRGLRAALALIPPPTALLRYLLMHRAELTVELQLLCRKPFPGATFPEARAWASERRGGPTHR
jgi:hypothetical protein